MLIKLKVKPNSRKNEINEIGENYYEARVSVPPEKGKANQRVIELLSKYFRIPKSSFTIIRGETGREKLIKLDM